MSRQETLNGVKRDLGFVPDWIKEMPDGVLEQYCDALKWVLSDTKLAARDKALVAYGAATAIHCSY